MQNGAENRELNKLMLFKMKTVDSTNFMYN